MATSSKHDHKNVGCHRLVLPLSGESVLATIWDTRRNQHRAAMIAVVNPSRLHLPIRLCSMFTVRSRDQADANPSFLDPWTIDDNGACFIIRDHNGQAHAVIAALREPYASICCWHWRTGQIQCPPPVVPVLPRITRGFFWPTPSSRLATAEIDNAPR